MKESWKNEQKHFKNAKKKKSQNNLKNSKEETWTNKDSRTCIFFVKKKTQGRVGPGRAVQVKAGPLKMSRFATLVHPARSTVGLAHTHSAPTERVLNEKRKKKRIT